MLLLKWIVCDVPQEQRHAFASAQQHWRAVAALQGFRGQFGGWSSQFGGRACIASLWHDQSALDVFMANAHDAIVARSKQYETYQSIRTLVVPCVQLATGRRQTIAEAMVNLTELRVTKGWIDMLYGSTLLMRLYFPTQALDDDLVGIEPDWNVSPVFIER